MGPKDALQLLSPILHPRLSSAHQAVARAPHVTGKENNVQVKTPKEQRKDFCSPRAQFKNEARHGGIFEGFVFNQTQFSSTFLSSKTTKIQNSQCLAQEYNSRGDLTLSQPPHLELMKYCQSVNDPPHFTSNFAPPALINALWIRGTCPYVHSGENCSCTLESRRQKRANKPQKQESRAKKERLFHTPTTNEMQHFWNVLVYM